MRPADPSSHPDDFLARCVDLYQQGRMPAVEEATARFVETCPDDGRFWQLLGVTRWTQGKYEEARSALETASCLRPLAPLGQVALAGCYRRTGQPEVARMMYQHLAGLETCPLELLPKVSVGLGCLGEFSLALDVCARLASREPRHHAAFFGMAFYMGKLGYPSASLLDPLVKAYNLAPRVLPYRLNLALLYAELNQPVQAYFLLEAVRPSMVPPCFALERLADIFAAVGDEDRCQEYRQWMAQAAEGNGGTVGG